MTVALSTIIFLPLSASPGSDAAVSERAKAYTPAENGRTQRVVDAPRSTTPPRSETCRSARRGTAWYRQRQRDWNALRSVPSRIGRKPHGCADARYLASVARERASIARRGYERWLERRTLRDFSFAPGADAWPKAVREVQRVFGGTEAWLLSCSAAEGGHGRWVGYGGQGYSTWLRDSDTVGGPLQFRYSTFKGMFRRSIDHVYAHGYRAPVFTSYTAAWRSALGQALAGGWARATGNDNSHWSASWGNGC